MINANNECDFHIQLHKRKVYHEHSELDKHSPQEFKSFEQNVVFNNFSSKLLTDAQ